MRHFDQARGLARQVSGHIHPAGIAKPAIDDHRHIDVQDIAVLDGLWPRNTVTDHMIDRNTGGMLIPPVANRGRGDAPALHFGGDEIIKRRGGDTRHHQRHDGIQNLSRDPARRVHPGEIRILVKANAIFCYSSARNVHQSGSAM